MDALAYALSLGTDPAVAEAAVSNLADRTCVWIVVSGKMCSGKDTLAPMILPALGRSDSVRVGYSDPMRAELQTAIDLLTGRTDTLSALAEDLVSALSLDPGHAFELARLLAPAVADPGHGLTGSSRTDLTRQLLQSFGTEWRCEDDEEYWSRMVSVMCLHRIAEGHSVYLTGGRFESDVRIPKSLGARIVRLDVSREVQLARLLQRDGLVPDAETLDHKGEVALDDWDGFDVRVVNDGEPGAALEAVTATLRARLNDLEVAA